MQQLIERLQHVGLSEREARLYLANLAQGPSTAQTLASEALVSRSTAYSVMESLKAMGLVSMIERDERRLFVAEHPERVVELLRRRTVDLSRQIEVFQANLSEFAAVTSREDRPRVCLYHGAEEIVGMLQDLACLDVPYVEYAPASLLYAVCTEPVWHAVRDQWVKRGQRGRLLLASTGDIETHRVTLQGYGCEVRRTEYPQVTAHLHVRGPVVVSLSMHNGPVGMWLEHAAVATCLSASFDHWWQQAGVIT